MLLIKAIAVQCVKIKKILPQSTTSYHFVDNFHPK